MITSPATRGGPNLRYRAVDLRTDDNLAPPDLDRLGLYGIASNLEGLWQGFVGREC